MKYEAYSAFSNPFNIASIKHFSDADASPRKPTSHIR